MSGRIEVKQTKACSRGASHLKLGPCELLRRESKALSARWPELQAVLFHMN